MGTVNVKDKVVYLSGPMSDTETRHYEDWNRQAFKDAEQALYTLGARYVFNPNEEIRDHHGRIPERMTRQEAMRFDLHRLTTQCMFDVLVMLDGVEDSVGALIEAEVAEQCGIKTVYLATLLEDVPEDEQPTQSLDIPKQPERESLLAGAMRIIRSRLGL